MILWSAVNKSAKALGSTQRCLNVLRILSCLPAVNFSLTTRVANVAKRIARIMSKHVGLRELGIGHVGVVLNIVNPQVSYKSLTLEVRKR